MKGVLEKAKTAKFKQHIEGFLAPAPQPDLAVGIDENIRLLSVLCSEMNTFVARLEIVQGTLQRKLHNFLGEQAEMQRDGEGDEEEHINDGSGNSSSWEQAANDALLAAGTVDALRQDILLIVSFL
jgi:hypothetical protein